MSGVLPPWRQAPGICLPLGSLRSTSPRPSVPPPTVTTTVFDAEAERGATPEPDLRGLPGLGGGESPPRAWVSGLYRRQVYPVRAFNRGVFHFCRAEPGPALGWFAEAIRESEPRSNSRAQAHLALAIEAVDA